MARRSMHLERIGGGVMCRASDVPSRWERTSNPEHMTCSRCVVVYRMHQRGLKKSQEARRE